MFLSSQENTCARIYFLIKLQAEVYSFVETLEQVFSCEFSEIFKNIFFTEHLRVTAFEDSFMLNKFY